MIDTGASNSITPCQSDLIGEIERSHLQSLKQVNDTTLVCGEEKVVRDIADFYGTRRSVITESYFVPSATICLF